MSTGVVTAKTVGAVTGVTYSIYIAAAINKTTVTDFALTTFIHTSSGIITIFSTGALAVGCTTGITGITVTNVVSTAGSRRTANAFAGAGDGGQSTV